MNFPKKTILFISHDATRTGAPILFLHFLKWLKANTDLSFTILLKDGGVLEPDFRALGPVMFFNKEVSSMPWLARKISRLRGVRGLVKRAYLRSLKRQLSPRDIGLVYSNTITNAEVLDLLSYLKCPVITHVHELEYLIRYIVGLQNFERVQARTQHYVVVSQAVRRNLVKKHRVPEDRIDVVSGFIPTTDRHQQNGQHTRDRIRAELGIPKDAVIVGACGTTIWQKGPDLFIQLAHAVVQRKFDLSVSFVWVGGDNRGSSFGALWHDVTNLGLEKHVHFIGDQPNALDYFDAFDIFALVSREDSFPLAMLEAASLGKPIVCFAESGGAEEFVEDDCGFVVPYLDIDAMADQIGTLLESQKLRHDVGQRAAEKVRERYDIEVGSRRILSIIQRFL